MALVSLTRARRDTGMVMDFHGAASASAHSHKVWATATGILPQGYSVVPAVEPSDQSDKPIGYGAFGVVW